MDPGEAIKKTLHSLPHLQQNQKWVFDKDQGLQNTLAVLRN